MSGEEKGKTWKPKSEMNVEQKKNLRNDSRNAFQSNVYGSSTMLWPLNLHPRRLKPQNEAK